MMWSGFSEEEKNDIENVRSQSEALMKILRRINDHFLVAAPFFSICLLIFGHLRATDVILGFILVFSKLLRLRLKKYHFFVERVIFRLHDASFLACSMFVQAMS